MRKILFVFSIALLTSSCGFLGRAEGTKASSSPTKVQKCVTTYESRPMTCTELSGNYPADCLGYGKVSDECPTGFTSSCTLDFKSYVANMHFYDSVDWIKSYYQENGINPDTIGVNWEEIDTKSGISSKEQCENMGGKHTDHRHQ